MKKLFLPVLLAVTFSSSAQKVSGNLKFQKGQKLEVVNNINSSTEMAMGESKNSSVSTDIYEVKNVSDSGITIEKSVKHIKLDISIMGQEKTIDSDKPEDLKGMGGEMVKDLLKSKQEFIIDGTGKIIYMRDAEKKDNVANPVMNTLMQQMNTGAALFKVGAGTIFQVLPSYEVKKDDSWTDSSSNDGGTMKTTYTLKNITDTGILLDYVGTGTLDTKQEMMGMSTSAKGTTQASGTITLDKATGLLKQKTATIITKSAISFSGQDMDMTSKVTSVTTVKTL